MTGTAKLWRARSAALVLVGIAAAVFAAGWFRPWRWLAPPKMSTVLAPDPVALAPGVYLLGKTEPAAVYVVKTSDGLVLIDSGLEAKGASVTDQLTELGLDVRQLRAILLTHVHGDHSLGAEHLRELSGAKVYAGRDDSQALRAGGPREAFFSTFHIPDIETHATTIDVELAGDETLEIGDARFGVLAAPGHTPGSLCYLLERQGLRVLFTGDVVQCLGLLSHGTLGTYAAYLSPLYRGNARDYLTTLRRLRALPLPDLILPGHPRMDAIPQNPNLTPEHWHALLDEGIRAMEQLQARYEADGANFLDGNPKEMLPGLYYLGDFASQAVYCLRSPKGLVHFDAPGGPALVGFLAESFQKTGWEERKPTAVLLTSADEKAIAGLAALVQHTGCKVVTPKPGLEAVRRACPGDTEILTEEDLEKTCGVEVQAIPLQGRGLAPMAYQFRWAGKSVLVSGRIPVKLSPPVMWQLHSEVTGPDGNPGQYLKSLDRLRQLTPHVWLPAMPVHGQNANLYDRDWEEVLEQNRQVFLR